MYRQALHPMIDDVMYSASNRKNRAAVVEGGGTYTTTACIDFYGSESSRVKSRCKTVVLDGEIGRFSYIPDEKGMSTSPFRVRNGGGVK